jgi:hypothetical protein
LYNHIVYTPRNGDTRVKSAREEIYFEPHKEAMWAAVDTYLVNTTWISKMSWKNDTDAEQQHAIEYNTKHTITKGEEVNHGFPIASTYKGLSLTMEGQEKVFDTTDTKNIKCTITVPPRSLVIFYQRRYKFKNSMFFILDAWGLERNVGSWGGTEFTRKECIVEVMGEDFVTLRREMDGTRLGTMDVASVDAVQPVGTTTKRDDCTGWCKDKLDHMRV